MPHAHNGDVSLYYESVGPADGLPLCLVKGFTAQMITWDQGFLDILCGHGFRVTMFDNRDVGLSTMTGGPGDTDGGYTMFDMADDAVAVMAAAGHPTFHVAGSSMGGMIVQRLLTRTPQHARSATLIYTSSNILRDSKQQGATAPLHASMTQDEYVAAQMPGKRATSSSRFPTPDSVYEAELRAVYDRSFRPDGVNRQRKAVVSTPDVEEELRKVSVPVSIMHGREDASIDVSAAFRLAELIPHSDVHVYDGWNHELPEPMWLAVASVIAETAARGERSPSR